MAKKKFGFGLVMGAVAGLIAGLLTAPKSGKETRDDLKRRADQAKEEATKRASEVKDRAGEAASDVAHKAKETAGQLKHAADSAVEGARQGYAKSREEGSKTPAATKNDHAHHEHNTKK